MFDLAEQSGGSVGGPVEQELLKFLRPILTGGLSIFNEELRTVAPRFDLSETKKDYCLTAKLPGVHEKNIRVHVSQDKLEISGEALQGQLTNRKNVYRFSRLIGSFQQRIALPSNIEPSKAKATFKKGILKVVLPKKAA